MPPPRNWSFYTDGDGQFDLAELPPWLPLMKEYDIVCGYRMNRQDNLVRRMNGWLWTKMTCMLFSLNLRDIDCAFKLYKRAIFDNLKMESTGALISTEILARAARKGYTDHRERGASLSADGRQADRRQSEGHPPSVPRALAAPPANPVRATDPMDHQKVNLFIYGSLRDSRIFQSVSGCGFSLQTVADR